MVDPLAAERTVWALRRAFVAVEAAKETRLRRLGVLPAHYGVLMNLGVKPGVTSAELARRLSVTPQNIASLVARLEDRGWVERREHDIHAHVRELYLTEEGRGILDSADAEVSALEEEVRRLLGDQAPVLREMLVSLAAIGASRP